MRHVFTPRKLSLMASTALSLVVANPMSWSHGAHAQDGAEKITLDEVVVTARRRDEQAIDVPVVVSAFTGEQLEKIGVRTLSDIGRLTPQLSVDANVAGFGGTITLRGVVSPTGTVSAEPATTINIDGVPLGFGTATQLGQFDLKQVEVLKGPQALFFGKNASGGIIALKTTDPTHELDMMLRGEYETKAVEGAVEGFVSGPISENLLGRLAVRYSDQKGYFRNDAPGVADRFGPGTKEIVARGTLLFEGSDALTVKLKGTYNKFSDIGSYFVGQRTYCPFGVPQGAAASPTITDCSPDGHTTRADLPAGIAQAAGDPLYRNGIPYRRAEAGFGVLDINYKISNDVSFNAITGLFALEQKTADGLSRGVVSLQNAAIGDNKKTWSQEVRFFSTTSSRFSWMMGAFFQDDHLTDREDVVLFTPPTTFTPIPKSVWQIDSSLYSGFGQASYNITEQLIASGGLRYTHEHKEQVVNLSPKFLPAKNFDNLSPEATLSYRVTPDINTFVSYKEGYKSGNFQVSSLAFRGPIANAALTSIDNVFREETVRGFEGGVKASLLDRSLRLNAAVYRYRYSNLQVSAFDPVAITIRVTNASSATVRGAEFDATYVPPSAPDLRLFGAMSYNKTTYRNFAADCYVGQTLGAGCTIDSADAGTVPDQQDLSGRTLPRAPLWSGNAGFSYQHDIWNNYLFTLGSQLLWQSKSYLSQELSPGGIRPSTVTFDANAAVGSHQGSWEVAVIGKNLGNKYYGILGSQVSGTGSAASTGTAGPGVLADYTAQVNRGREIWLRLTLRPTAF